MSNISNDHNILSTGENEDTLSEDDETNGVDQSFDAFAKFAEFEETKCVKDNTEREELRLDEDAEIVARLSQAVLNLNNMLATTIADHYGIDEVLKALAPAGDSLSKDDLRRHGDLVGQSLDEQDLKNLSENFETIPIHISQYNPAQADAREHLGNLDAELVQLMSSLKIHGLEGVGLYQVVCGMQLAISAESLRQDLDNPENADPAIQENLKKTSLDDFVTIIDGMWNHVNGMRNQWRDQMMNKGGEAWEYVAGTHYPIDNTGRQEHKNREHAWRDASMKTGQARQYMEEYCALREPDIFLPDFLTTMDEYRNSLLKQGAIIH